MMDHHSANCSARIKQFVMSQGHMLLTRCVKSLVCCCVLPPNTYTQTLICWDDADAPMTPMCRQRRCTNDADGDANTLMATCRHQCADVSSDNLCEHIHTAAEAVSGNLVARYAAGCHYFVFFAKV
eukprot:TRINITY_DN7576_c0_g2_i1.p1 TRINITY_DN7576_c0_g2~~TRINITY_DN7576_c0_g2_i1.p1  ORF type:complete len:126 (+),score=13.19 TRINITY_DN7576_c0_g2_i1:322-699(+)